jgi:hypothetical protein
MVSVGRKLSTTERWRQEKTDCVGEDTIQTKATVSKNLSCVVYLLEVVLFFYILKTYRGRRYFGGKRTKVDKITAVIPKFFSGKRLPQNCVKGQDFSLNIQGRTQ